jgi:hypothetical protein
MKWQLIDEINGLFAVSGNCHGICVACANNYGLFHRRSCGAAGFTRRAGPVRAERSTPPKRKRADLHKAARRALIRQSMQKVKATGEGQWPELV